MNCSSIRNECKNGHSLVRHTLIRLAKLPTQHIVNVTHGLPDLITLQLLLLLLLRRQQLQTVQARKTHCILFNLDLLHVATHSILLITLNAENQVGNIPV